MKGRRRFVVHFEMTAQAADVEWFGIPSPEWIEEMVAGPGSVWELGRVTVTEAQPPEGNPPGE